MTKIAVDLGLLQMAYDKIASDDPYPSGLLDRLGDALYLQEPPPKPKPDAIARAVEAEREAICELADNLLRTSDALPLIHAIRARGSNGTPA